MKKLINRTILVLLPIILITSAYKKEGIGGKSSVSGTVYHHTKPIPYTTVYIKYGATEFPGTDVTIYDDHTTADINANYAFHNLRMGNYYLYGVGYDNAIFLPVTGGVGVKLKYDKSVSLDVPVTE